MASFLNIWKFKLRYYTVLDINSQPNSCSKTTSNIPLLEEIDVTCSRAHPVGRKASKLWKMSPTVRWRVVNRITRITRNPINRNILRSLNINWKSALNFFLPLETICDLIGELESLYSTSHDHRTWHGFEVMNTNL